MIEAQDASEPQAACAFRDAMATLRVRDNHSNLVHLSKPLFLIAGSIGGTIWFWEYVQTRGLSLWWALPVTVTAMLVIGASQHVLATAMHEASHYMLFRNRRLNELVSDWLCAFPLFMTTQNYRTVHFSHHLYTNDVERDPELGHVLRSGNWPGFPRDRRSLIRALVKLSIMPLRWIRFTLTAGRDMTLGGGGPLVRPDADARWAKTGTWVFLGYAIATPPILGATILLGGGAMLLGAIMAALWGVAAGFFALMPRKGLTLSRIPPVIGERATAVLRVTHVALMYAGVYWAEYLTGIKFGNYFVLLWVLPIFTTFSVFSMLREIGQHGNRGVERYQAARVSMLNPLIVYAVFPFGNDYHLPHHLYASVPHYRLRALHELLMRNPEYARPDLQTRGLTHRKLGENDLPGLLEALASPPAESCEARIKRPAATI